MVKAILKEVIITVLLLIAVVLVMSVVFYDYNPISKVVPAKIQYTTSQEVKNELDQQDADVELGTIEKTYTIDSSDLRVYEKNNSYVAGKANPFADTSTTTNAVDVDTNTTGGTTTNPTTTNTNPDSTGTFFNNTGK